jgi:hypothetical protein
MNKTITGILTIFALLLAACQPAMQPAAPAAGEPAATAPADGATPTQPAVSSGESMEGESGEVPPAPLENTATPADTSHDLAGACFGLITGEEFNAICGRADPVVLTPKISDGNCWVNIADHANNKLTAGFTVVDWKQSDEANKEFDRGVKARIKQGAVEGKDVGERSYQYAEIGRHNVVWARGDYLTRLAAMTNLCPADKLIAVGQKIDSRLH